MMFDTETAGECSAALSVAFRYLAIPSSIVTAISCTFCHVGRSLERRSSRAVLSLASTESNCETIPGADHPPEFYCICDPPFNLNSEMMTAQVTMNIPLVND